MPYVNYRMLPPPGGGTWTNQAGRTYTGADGVVQDVPQFDTQQLVGHGWSVIINCPCGPTAERPAKPLDGEEFLDTTVGCVIAYNALRKAWLNPLTGAAV